MKSISKNQHLSSVRNIAMCKHRFTEEITRKMKRTFLRNEREDQRKLAPWDKEKIKIVKVSKSYFYGNM